MCIHLTNSHVVSTSLSEGVVDLCPIGYYWISFVAFVVATITTSLFNVYLMPPNTWLPVSV